jgi:hypothetical protein
MLLRVECPCRSDPRASALRPRSRNSTYIIRYMASAKKKARYYFNSGPINFYQGRILVAWGGIEPPTRGFSIRCSTN